MDLLKDTRLVQGLIIIAGLLLVFLNLWRQYKKNKLIVTLKIIAGIVIVVCVPWLDYIYREKDNEQLNDIKIIALEQYKSSHAISKDTNAIKKDTTQIKAYLEALKMSGVSDASANVIGESLKKR